MAKSELRKLKTMRRKFTDQIAILDREVAKIDKEIRKLTLLGYRAILSGDEYNFGHYSDFLFKNYDKTEAYERAKKEVAESKNGGHIEDVYKSNLEHKGEIR